MVKVVLIQLTEIQPINTTSTDTTFNTTNNTTLEINTTDKDTTMEQIQPINTTQEELIQPIQPETELIQLPKCSRCSELENSISNFTNLYYQEQDQTKEQKRTNHQLAKQVKELELKIISLQETNQILRKDISYWQDKEVLKELETSKEKIKELISKNQAWEQKYSRLENTSKNQSNYLSMPDLNQLIEKHKNYQNSQHLYSEKDRKEREFLKSLYDKIWTFAG